MTRPFQLDQGVFLEDNGLLIPWLTPKDTLATIGSPEMHPGEIGETQLLWRSTVVLGGLPCTLSTRLRTIDNPLRNKSKSHWANSDKLRYMDFTRLPLDEFPDERVEFEATKAHLLPFLGNPTHSHFGPNDAPRLKWCFPEFSILHAIEDRFTEYCVLEARHSEA